MAIRAIRIDLNNKKEISRYHTISIERIKEWEGYYLTVNTSNFSDVNYWREDTFYRTHVGTKWKMVSSKIKTQWVNVVYIGDPKSIDVMRAIIIRKSNETEIKTILPVEDAEGLLFTCVGDIIVIKEDRTHEVHTQKHFQSLYDVYATSGSWMLISRREFKPEETHDQDLPPNVKRRLEGISEPAEERKFEVTRTTHNKTDMLALEITEENYSIAAGFLPQGFTSIPVEEVIGYFVVINERKVRVNLDTGVVENVGVGNLVIHPDIFHDIYIGTEFEYGDFIKCRKEI